MAQSGTTRVAVVGGARTPFAKAGTRLRQYSALDLSVHAVTGLLQKHRVDPSLMDELVHGIVIVDPKVPNIAREVVLSSELSSSTPAYTISNNCVTGASAVTSVHDSIVSGRADAGIAGGVDSMSNPPVLFGHQASRIFLDLSTAKSVRGRIGHLLRLRPWHFKPSAAAFAEPSTGLTMGEHAEMMVKEWKISRDEQDEISYRSHRNAHKATEDGRLTAEIHPLEGLDHDLLIRPDTSMERLAKLPPVFDRSPSGSITAGSSSPLTDGAAVVLLMSEERARKENREPLAFIKDFEYAAVDPSEGLLMAPGIAVPRLLRRTGIQLSDLDIVEMHEAFGGQVACNLKAWEQGWKEEAIGTVDPEKLNPLGSSIAVGHPFAATGARIVTTLANEMKRRDAELGLISICGAGGTAIAILLERDGSLELE